MKLLRLEMENWRSFYGPCPPIEFATGKKNVTVFHGFNGSGKTNLLNALTWLFAKETTPNFQLPKQLVNKQAILDVEVGEKVTAKIECVFEHEDRKHRAIREVQVTRKEPLQESWDTMEVKNLRLSSADDSGDWMKISNPQDVLDKYLPPTIRDFFFFDGESIGTKFRHNPTQQKLLAEQMMKFSGREIYARSIQHLSSAGKILDTELLDAGDEELTELMEKKKDLTEKCDTKKQERVEKEKEVKLRKDKLNLIEVQLAELGKAAELQQERNNLIKREEVIQKDIRDGRDLRSKHIERNAFSVCLSEPLKYFNDQVEKLQNRGELPSGIKRSFVEKILADDVCICMRSLAESDAKEERRNVEDWLNKSGLSDVEERVVRMDGRFLEVERQKDDFWTDLGQLQKVRQEKRQDLKVIQDRLEEIGRELSASADDEVAKLEGTRNKLKREQEVLFEEIGKIQGNMDDLQGALNQIDVQIDLATGEKNSSELARKRVSLARSACQCIEDMAAVADRRWRHDLQAKIKERYSQATVTPYEPNLTEDYRLELTDNSGDEISLTATSGGEGQILALCFVGSIIDLQKQRLSQEETLAGTNTSEYPVVMDSPYGALTGRYRKISEYLANISDQVVVLVTDSQWEGVNEEILQPHVGRTYLMVYHTTRSPEDLEVDDDGLYVRIDGHKHSLVESSATEYEWTEIIEVADA